jgi:hypothetical protein
MKRQFKELTSGAMSDERVSKFWLDLVAYYTSLGLTHDSNILPAISGLSRMIGSRLCTPYLAGLWQSNLVNCLRWVRDCSCQSSTYAANSTAPTWSWASLRWRLTANPEDHFRSVSFKAYTPARFRQDLRLKIISANCTRATSNPYGQVLSDFINIEAPFILAILTVSGEGIHRMIHIHRAINPSNIGAILDSKLIHHSVLPKHLKHLENLNITEQPYF